MILKYLYSFYFAVSITTGNGQALTDPMRVHPRLGSPLPRSAPALGLTPLPHLHRDQAMGGLAQAD